MEDKRHGRIPLHNCSAEGVYYQIICYPLSHGPADNGSGEDIENDSKIEPTFVCPDLSNVRYPDDIRSIDDFPGKKIRHDGSRMSGMGCNLIPSFHLCPYALCSHKPRHSVFTADNPLGSQFFRYPRASIGLSSQGICFPDMIHQFIIPLLSATHGSSLPPVIGAPCYVEYPAHLLHPERGAILIHKEILHLGRFEKMAKAFFKISRSSLRSAFSRFRRLNSSSSGFNLPFPGKGCCVSSIY